MNKILFIFILLFFINFKDVIGEKSAIIDGAFKIIDVTQNYSSEPYNNYYSNNNQCSSMVSYFIIEQLSSIEAKSINNGNSLTNKINGSQLWNFYGNAPIGLSYLDVVIYYTTDGDTSKNYTFSQFVQVNCTQLPNPIHINFKDNQIYKYPYRNSIGSIFLFPNTEKYLTNPNNLVFYGFLVQLSNNYYSNSINAYQFKNYYKLKLSIGSKITYDKSLINGTIMMPGNQGITIDSIYLKPFLTSNTSLLNIKNDLTVATYPSNCNSLKFGQCVVLIDVSIKQNKGLDYFLQFHEYVNPVLVSGSKAKGQYYLSIVPNVFGSAIYNVSSFEVDSFKSTILNNYNVSLAYYDRSYILVNQQYNLTSQNITQAITGGQISYLGRLLTTTKKEGYRNWVEWPISFPYIGATTSTGKFKYAFSYPVNKYSRSTTTSMNYAASYKWNDLVTTTFYFGVTLKPIFNDDQIIPEIQNIEYSDNGDSISVFITASDLGGSGIADVTINIYNPSIQYNYYGDSSDLIAGTIFNGTYQINVPKVEIRKDFYIQISDYASNSASFRVYMPYSGLYKTVKPFDLPILNPTEDVKMISFLNNNVDLSNTPMINNEMYIQLVNPNYKNLVFQVKFSTTILDSYSEYYYSNADTGIESLTFTSKWNETLGLYVIKFSLPARLPTGAVPYMLNPLELDSSSIYSFFGSPSELYVYSNECDIIGPIVDSLERIPSNGQIQIPTFGSSDVLAGFILNITDTLNGISSVYLRITSNKDLVGFSFKFENITGNPSFYIVNATFPITMSDAPQSYKISEMKLIDGQGFISRFPYYLEVNPLFKFINQEPSINLLTSTFSTPTNEDTIPPTLTNWTFIVSESLDQKTKTIDFYFTIQDLISGVSIVNNPQVFISTDHYRILYNDSNIVSKIVATGPNSFIYSSVNYQASITIPYLLGYGSGILTSIYGIYDNHRNLISYLSNNITDLGFKSFIEPPLNEPLPPFINLVSVYDDSNIIIDGIRFGSKPIIKIQREQDNVIFLKQIDGLFTNRTNLYFNITDLKQGGFESKDFNISISISNEYFNQFSNIKNLTIISSIITQSPTVTLKPTPSPTPTPTQTPLPTNTPSTCKGDPICGGELKGKCTSSGSCECISPYFGESCNSMVLTDIIPVIDQTQPKVQLQYQKSVENKVSSLVSIYSLRELDFNNQVVNEYILSSNDWKYQSSDDNLLFTYSTEIINKNDQTKTTNITVALRKFENETTIEFADEKINLLPSTIKYYITLSPYQFINNLHSLELIMYASIETSESKDVCGSSQFGESSSQQSSQFMKVSINDISLYAEFIRRGIADDKIIAVSNQFLTYQQVKGIESTTDLNSQQSFIAISIPFYSVSLELDPNFAVLLDLDQSNTCNNSNGLSKNQLIGIIIGSVAFALVIIIGITFLVFRNSTNLRIKVREFKLKSFK